MPICPKCSSKFHRGAEVQCPCCGYSLLEANGIFGNKTLPLARITDTAGILTHRERMALAHFLEKLERRVPPAALCVYVTDHGRLADFRSHAHWALNHARPRHETFGKRGRSHALDEPRILVRDPAAGREEEPPASRFREWKEELVEAWRDLVHPVPPPVRPEWTLLLVLDVQLETACFAWGYMLDPYVDPDRINATLMKRARQLFRERSTQRALEVVMEGAAHHLAARAHALKKRFSVGRLWGKNALVGAAATAAILLPRAEAVPLHDLPDLPSLPPLPGSATGPASPTPAPAAAPATPPATPPAPPSAPTPSAPTAPTARKASVPATNPRQGAGANAASETPVPPAANASPHTSPSPAQHDGSAADNERDRFPADWSVADRELLLQGAWWQSVPQLFPGTGEDIPDSARSARTRDASAEERRAAPENDATVPELDIPRYLRPESSGLIDPQNLMSEPQRVDLRRLLGELHRSGNCRFYVALFGRNQKEPLSLSAQKLIAQVGKLHERSVLLHYHLGDAASLGIAYDSAFLKELTDAQRSTWQNAAREAAASYPHAPDALYAALTTLAAGLHPAVEALPPRALEEEDALTLEEEEAPAREVALVPISLDRDNSPKKADWRTRLRALPNDPAFAPAAATVGGILAVLSLLVVLVRIRRRNARLDESAADIRLSSPAGAGVSRVVHYMEGRETGNDARSVL